MKIGIDSYCYHRFFDEVYPEQQAPPKRRTMDDLIATAKRLGVGGLSVETVFMPSLDRGFLLDLRGKLDDAGLERVLAWGHPSGLETGKNPAAAEELRAHYASAEILGATVMRMTCGSFAFRGQEPVQDQIARLVPILKELATEAGARGITLGMENHGDFIASEVIELVERVDSPFFRVTLDTGNNLRLLEDPVLECVKLAPYAVATHLKDIAATGTGSPRDWKRFWPSIGLGNGIVDLKVIMQALKDNGYGGLLCVEIDVLPPGRDEDTELESSIAYLKRTLPTLT
jgi:sugar phosphate isomerase/epimerase